MASQFTNLNTTINITLQDGTKINLAQKYNALGGTLNNPSLIDILAQKTGRGFYAGALFKKVRRTQVNLKEAAKKGDIGGFKGASSQNLHYTEIRKLYRTDNLIFDLVDVTKLKESKGGGIIAKEVADFILTGKELDLFELFAELQTKATSAKLHSAFDNNGAPTGTQPAASGDKEANAIADIKAGKRIIKVANLDENNGTRLKLIREAIAYLNTIGTKRNKGEPKYLFSINGISLDNIKVITTYKGSVALRDESSINFIKVGANTQRNLTGIVAFIDNKVEVLQSNQIPTDAEYVVLSNRTMIRDLDPITQFNGVIQPGGGAIVMEDGTTKNLNPHERQVQFEQGRVLGTWYWEEAFFIGEK